MEINIKLIIYILTMLLINCTNDKQNKINLKDKFTDYTFYRYDNNISKCLIENDSFIITTCPVKFYRKLKGDSLELVDKTKIKNPFYKIKDSIIDKSLIKYFPSYYYKQKLITFIQIDSLCLNIYKNTKYEIKISINFITNIVKSNSVIRSWEMSLLNPLRYYCSINKFKSSDCFIDLKGKIKNQNKDELTLFYHNQIQKITFIASCSNSSNIDITRLVNFINYYVDNGSLIFE